MHLFLAAPQMGRFLSEEISRASLGTTQAWIADDLLAVENVPDIYRGPTVFSHQCLPKAVVWPIPSIRLTAESLATELIQKFPDDIPWRLHVVARYGIAEAGLHRCQLIREGVVAQLKKRNRSLLKQLDMAPLNGVPNPLGSRAVSPPFQAQEGLVQLLLTSPETGYLSLLNHLTGQMPSQWIGTVSPFLKGVIPIAVDKGAPSRAFAKLVESEHRLGKYISQGESCVDLGASPGSWTYIPAQRGAQVIAVDRSPLREDLMRHSLVKFVQGDAFQFAPSGPVDWLLCDVIAAPERSIRLLIDWVRERRCRQFVVTIKFRGDTEYALLDELKSEMPKLCEVFHLLHLCANKNEVSAFGIGRRFV